MDRKPKVAVVGCGSIARFHFDGYEKAGARVVRVCDVSEEAARPWAQRFDAVYTKDFSDVVADLNVDVVDITTITRCHKEMCLAAIGAGKAVICEKTLAENADDALEIVRAARERGTIFYTSYMKRFIPAVEKAKELLPEIGEIVSTHIRAYQSWGDVWRPNPPDGWLTTPPDGMSVVRFKNGGGILHCGGSHILDLVHFFLGRPHRLYASIHTPQDRDFDIRASALLETANGPVHFDALSHPHTHTGFLRDGWDERMEIVGVRGKLEILSAAWDQWATKASVLIHHDDIAGTVTEHRFAPVSPFAREIAFFLENIARGEQGSQSPLTGYEVDEVIAAMHRSSEQKQAVDVLYRLNDE